VRLGGCCRVGCESSRGRQAINRIRAPWWCCGPLLDSQDRASTSFTVAGDGWPNRRGVGVVRRVFPPDLVAVSGSGVVRGGSFGALQTVGAGLGDTFRGGHSTVASPGRNSRLRSARGGGRGDLHALTRRISRDAGEHPHHQAPRQLSAPVTKRSRHPASAVPQLAALQLTVNKIWVSLVRRARVAGPASRTRITSARTSPSDGLESIARDHFVATSSFRATPANCQNHSLWGVRLNS